MNEDERAGRFFDGFAETFDTLYEGKRSRWMQWIDRNFRSDIYLRFSRTFARFGDLTGQTVLDIGGGSGVYAMEALRGGAAHAVAVYPAEGMLRLLQQRVAQAGWKQRCTLVQGTFPQVAVEPADHAIVMGVMD